MSGESELERQGKRAAERSAAAGLRGLTPARVGLESSGISVATRPALEFSLAHSLARDAVHAALSVVPMVSELRERGLHALAVKSAAHDRAEYLRRPDLGRRLEQASLARLKEWAARPEYKAADGGSRLSIVVADGLSALAVERHALALLDALLPCFVTGWSMLPVIVAEQGRVALGDEIGEALGADATVMLIGERPGLSAPDSLGAYITWSPKLGRTDAERNCVSNVRAEGLDYATAASRIGSCHGGPPDRVDRSEGPDRPS